MRLAKSHICPASLPRLSRVSPLVRPIDLGALEPYDTHGARALVLMAIGVVVAVAGLLWSVIVLDLADPFDWF